MKTGKLLQWLMGRDERIAQARLMVGTGDLGFWEGFEWGQAHVEQMIRDGEFDE